jgi:hypothetical protein
MPVGAHELEQVADALGAGGVSAAAVAELRRSLPGVSLTLCDASDLGVEEPFRSFPGFELYLVDGRDHCWRLTSEPAEATGLMIARRRAA